MNAELAIFHFLFGSPRALFFAHVLDIVFALAPCHTTDTVCAQQHREAAQVIVEVAFEDEDPEGAAELLAGVGAHETGFRTRVQAHGGPAVSWFQVEVPRGEREALLADDHAAARLALARARSCGGSMLAYAGGRCSSRNRRVIEVATQLRRCVESARRGGAWACRNWHTKVKLNTRKRRHKR